MTIWRKLESWLFWFPWYRRRARDHDLERELRNHLELEAEELRAAGLSPKAATDAAHRALGNTLRIEEDVRAAWGFQWLEAILQDVRLALRALGKSPGFTAVAVLTLALGIGANTALFSVVDAVLLHPLPFRNPGKLVWLTESLPSVPDNNVSWLDMQDWKQQNNVFEGIAGYSDFSLVLTGSGNPQLLPARFVSRGYFKLMGMTPFLGRTFKSEEHLPSGPLAVILSHSFWERHFAGDPAAIGKVLDLSGKARTIVGVMPAGFGSVTHTKLWGTFERDAPKGILTSRQFSWGMYAIARLKPGVTLEQARTNIRTVSERLEREYPKTTGGLSVMLPLTRRIVGNVRPALWILSAAVFFVLLIACANIASLLLVKGVGRRKEIALRLALGAGKWRLFRQLMVENLVLGTLGAGVGLLLAFAGTKFLTALLPSGVPFANLISVDRTVLLFTAGLGLLAGLVCGLAPALMGLRMNFHGVLKSGTHQIQGGRHRAHRTLVIAEIGLALALLAGAGLMVRSMVDLSRVAPGFDTHQLLTMESLLSRASTLPRGQMASMFDQAILRVRQLPGVESAAAAFPVPFSDKALQSAWNLVPLAIKGRIPRPRESTMIHTVVVSQDYFRTLGIPLIAGRTFTAADNDKSPRVAVIDQEVAKRYWQGQDPVGSRIRFGTQDYNDVTATPPPLTVVGVVGAVKAGGLDADYGGYVYLPDDQQPTNAMIFVVRSRAAPLSLARSAEAAIHQAMPGSPVVHVQTMEGMVEASQAVRRLSVRLLGAFSLGALLLAMLGLYGVISYVVSQSTNEIGVRMALGAPQANIRRLVLGQGMRLALWGTAVGIAAALALTRLMSSLLYGVAATDPFTFVGAGILLVAVAMLACYVPARRAMHVDPMTALRDE